jgi:hypothetical protein
MEDGRLKGKSRVEGIHWDAQKAQKRRWMPEGNGRWRFGERK